MTTRWLIDQVSDLGFAGIVLAAIAATCAIALVMAAFLAAWRFFRPLSAKPELSGVKFFPDRSALHKAHGTLGDKLSQDRAESLFAIWVVGQKYLHAQADQRILKKLLLPDPSGDAIAYSANLKDHGDILGMIRTMTEKAQRHGIEVKWYKHYIFQSINIVDPDKSSGWAHVELVLPYSDVERRPAFTVRKSESESTVIEFKRIFDLIWEEAHWPNDTTSEPKLIPQSLPMANRRPGSPAG